MKSNYKEISGSVLKPELVSGAYSEASTRLVIIDVDLLIRPREEMVCRQASGAGTGTGIGIGTGRGKEEEGRLGRQEEGEARQEQGEERGGENIED